MAYQSKLDLRFYISSPNPSKELIMITSFILTFYAPIWFHIKEHSSCIDGAKNFFFILQLLKDQPPQIHGVVRPVLQRNSFGAHPENILLCQIHDDDISIRQDAISKVIRAREYARNEQEPKLTNFIAPKINWNASNYFTMAECESVTPPPLLSEYTEDQLRSIVDTQRSIQLLPCHTQAVERGIKLVTESSDSVYVYEARHG